MKKNLNFEIIISLSFVLLVFIVDGLRLYFTENLGPYQILKKEASELSVFFLLMLAGAAIAIALVFIYVIVGKKGKDNNTHKK